MVLILLGAPGSGKGTQAAEIVKDFHMPSISTGDLLREQVKKNSDLGKRAKQYMDRGELVPDSLIKDMLANRIQGQDCKKGFILDGFPRNVSQAEQLEDLLEKAGKRLDAVINVDVDQEAVVKRLSNRLTCSSCKAGYNRLTKPSKVENICDACGGKLFQRDDDKEETIRNRLDVYQKQTAPLIACYTQKKKIVNVNGNRDISAIYSEIKTVLQRVEA